MADNEFLSACVADIRIDAHAEGCKLTDFSFHGFGSNSVNPTSSSITDVISVTIRKVDTVCPEPTADHHFSASVPTSPEAIGYDWLLQTFADGTEVITVTYHQGHELQAAQIRIRDSVATLLIAPRYTKTPSSEANASFNSADSQSSSESKELTELRRIREAKVFADAPVDPYIYPLYSLFLSRILLRRGGFLLHSSAVCVGIGKGMVFTAPSGTGKSTIANIMRQKGAVIINDDIVAIRLPHGSDSLPKAYNIPMPHYKQKPKSTTIRRLYNIWQSPENTISHLSKASALSAVLTNVIQQPLDAESVRLMTQNVLRFIELVPIARLGFKPDTEVIDLLRIDLCSKSPKPALRQQ